MTGFTWLSPATSPKKIDSWLMNSQMVGLKKLGPHGSQGFLLLSVRGISHALNSRMLKENLGCSELVELLDALFVKGGYSLCSNQSTGDSGRRYDRQLVAFKNTYKSKKKKIQGRSPAAILQLQLEPEPHLEIVTAYWVNSRKAEALRKSAL